MNKIKEFIEAGHIHKDYFISDAEIDAVWGNANFGQNTDKHSIILSTLLKIGGDYAVGYTAMSICRELGLLTPKSTSRDARLTKKGKRVMYHWNNAANARTDIKALYEAAENMAEALRGCRKELWDEWHSSMSEDQFNSDPTIEDIDQVLTQYNILKTKKD